eukprot:TRINITY_DN15767_c0_g1_i1.p1 TRINITY_DN15767_c0_g1~~TRINITY_DN15767_c0_g1_i1.p1  ORF type:complete len:467 (+),score=133.70 TRINITY_DN15767_c0_g1_i1:45-1445(+)
MRNEEVGLLISADHGIVTFSHSNNPGKQIRDSGRNALKRKQSSDDASPKRMREEAEICALPEDSIAEIMSYINFEEKRVCRLVNKYFCQLVDSRYLIQIIDAIQVPGFSIQEALSLWPKVMGFRLPEMDENDYESMRQFPARITHLDLVAPQKRCWSDHVLDLSISDAMELEASAEDFRNLTSLKLIDTYDIDLSQAAHLTSLSLTHTTYDDSEGWDEMLDALPHPEKMTRLHLWLEGTSEEEPKNLDRFVHVTDLKLGNLFTSTPLDGIKKLHISMKTDETQADWLMRLPKSITHLELEVGGNIGHGSKLDFPNLQHLCLRDDSQEALPFFAKMPSVHTITLDDLDRAKNLPPSCTRLNFVLYEDDEPDDEPLVLPNVKDLHLHLKGFGDRIKQRIDSSQVRNLIIHPDKWPTMELLDQMIQLNAKFSDPMLNILLNMTPTERKRKWEELKSVMPWYHHILDNST